MFSIAILLFTGCSPHDATLSDGYWFTWLANNSSNIIADDTLPFLQNLAETSAYDETLKVSMYECKRSASDDGYLAPQDGFTHITGDDCADIDTIDYENYKFIQTDGYYLLQQPLEPWRAEAFINGEGDLQFSFHHYLPNDEDFRFTVAIDPRFRPVVCTTDVSGEPQVEYLDGSDWVYQWSTDEDGYQIYYLNAGAYQINPSDSNKYWFLTTDMLSGFSHAKFSSEEFNSIPTTYGNYDEDGEGDGFMLVNNRNAPDYEAYAQAVENLQAQSDLWATQLAMYAGANIDGAPAFTHKVEGNEWRPINTSNSGLDGWGEVHASWVRISNDSVVEPGGTVKGDFQITYTASESNSHMLIKGSFEIPDLKEDPWSYPILEDVKRTEKDTPFCGGAQLGE